MTSAVGDALDQALGGLRMEALLGVILGSALTFGIELWRCRLDRRDRAEAVALEDERYLRREAAAEFLRAAHSSVAAFNNLETAGRSGQAGVVPPERLAEMAADVGSSIREVNSATIQLVALLDDEASTPFTSFPTWPRSDLASSGWARSTYPPMRRRKSRGWAGWGHCRAGASAQFVRYSR